MKNIFNIDGMKDLEEKLSLWGIALIHFGAERCTPCEKLGESLQEIAENNKDVCIFKVDVEENEEIAKHYEIKNLPQVHICKDGKKVDQFITAIPSLRIQNYVNMYKKCSD